MTLSQCCDQTVAIRTSHRPWVLRLLDRYLDAHALHKQHQALLHLDDTLLRDIGITRSEAMKIAASPVWDAPTHWKR